MKNYAEMSDFEIDKAIFELKFGTLGTDVDALRFWNEGKFRPCNSWADAGPIIAVNKINLKSIVVNRHDSTWEASFMPAYKIHKFKNKNPLRAAMIVFLMMQESK